MGPFLYFNRLKYHMFSIICQKMLTTKKALECMAIIKKYSKDFGGSLEDLDVIKLCGCSRNSYYKYKKEAKSN